MIFVGWHRRPLNCVKTPWGAFWVHVVIGILEIYGIGGLSSDEMFLAAMVEMCIN